MGLLYAQSAIKQNGGDIVLLPHSAGQGAAFVVMLPLTAIHHEEASAL
jgi:signal transduction histidine kinase